MNLTKKTEYALRALVEMASQADTKPMRRRSIAQRQKISENFLEQIFLHLQKSGIILSVRGPGGGFKLAKKPDEITVMDVNVAVDGSDKYIQHCDPETDVKCEQLAKCKIKFIWQEIDDALLDTMQNITLSDVLNR